MDIDRRPKRMQLMTGPGGGKTTLARQLSSRLNVPCYNLAHTASESGAGRKIVLEERVESLRRIIVQPGWITEGAFLWWTEPFPKSLGHGFALTQETMHPNINLWLWLVPYILLLLFM